MTVKEYIESGKLELFVAGKMSVAESRKVVRLTMKYAAIKMEVEQIEKSLQLLTAGMAPYSPSGRFDIIKSKISFTKPDPIKNTYEWRTYTGWAAAIIFAVCASIFLFQFLDIKAELSKTFNEKEIILKELGLRSSQLEESKFLLSILQDPDNISVELQAQTDFPDSRAMVYWNPKENVVYLDVRALPTPPEGMVYQIWSLELDPLSPISLGTIDDFISGENILYNKKNPYPSQAFGITLEPEGGSLSPNLEKLHSFGLVSPS